MANINRLASYIAEEINKVDDLVLIEKIKFAIRNYRALYLRQDYQQNRGLNLAPHLVTIKMKLIPVINEEVYIGNCKLTKTELKVPKPVRTERPNPFNSVSNIDGTIIFDYATLSRLNNKKFSRFKNLENYYLYQNNFIYIEADNHDLEFVYITDIFEDYEEVLETLICCDSCYSDDDFDYPLSADLEARIIDTIINKFVQLGNVNSEQINLNPNK